MVTLVFVYSKNHNPYRFDMLLKVERKTK